MDSRIGQALGFINKNIDRNLSLRELAEANNLSYTYFSELFKQEAGTCFHEYLSQRRIAMAKELLTDDSLSIKQISYSLGYKNTSSFSRKFKKKTKQSPSEYRKKTFINNRTRDIFKAIRNLVKKIRKPVNRKT